ncbi:hypothetical protein BNJ_00368 [Kaumoebavirus]|uniref:hypothetical protein n=1 Tax=Kaumoebavirus TaxID=1859492 RepID=UPI0009C3DCB6|nr:hypothetical protein BNJ_00368 [Kaumoebavirus]ARA72188.1 hypothetical protein BNJ_00368 [Kaumoebavirus]
MQPFLSNITRTGYVPECTGLSKEAFISFYNFERSEKLKYAEEITNNIKGLCAELMKDETLSPKLREDLTILSLIKRDIIVINPDTHDFKTFWSTGKLKDPVYASVFPDYLYELLFTMGQLLRDRVVKVCGSDQDNLKMMYNHFYESNADPTREQVSYEWKSVATKITYALMVDGKIDKDLCQKMSLMFLNEPPVTPTSLKVDAKWRDHVETYFGMIMKKNFDPDFVARVCKEAYLESRK